MAAHKFPGVSILFLALSVLPHAAQGLTQSTLALSATANPSTFGAAVTLTATVTPTAATGRVTFYDGVTVLGTKSLSGGAASFVTRLLPSGPRKLRAYYAGDANNQASTSNVVSQTVNAQSSVSFATGTTPAVSTQIVAGDFNGDGIADLATSNGGTISVLLGRGDGTFQTATASPFIFGIPVAVADFNGDGKADLLVQDQNPANGFLYVQAGNGDGTFQSAIKITSAASSVGVGDFNGDGIPDLALNAAAGVNILIGKGDGTFQTPVLYLAGVITASLNLAVGDFNGDGKADLAVSNQSTVSILLGNGDGTFGAPQADSAPTQANFIVVADINKDGKADLITLSVRNKVSVQLGNGNGTFQAPLTTFLASFAMSVAVGDFNGDGNADLAVGSVPGTSPDTVSILRGAGDGTFQPPLSYTISGASALISGEFNGDGKTDLLALGTLLLGTNRSLTATGGTPQSITVSTAFPVQLEATFLDGATPVSGATVTFTPVPSSGGASAALSNTSVTTNASGVARVTATANAVAGSYQVTASSQGLGATFSLTNTAQPSSTLTLVTGNQQSAPNGAPFPNPLKVKLTDPSGNPVSGTTVTFALPPVDGLAVLSSTTAVTDSLGFASVTATAGNKVGATYTATASVGQLSVSFTLFNGLGATVVLGASPNPATLGAPVTLTLSAPFDAAGRVTFYDGATVLGTRTLSGNMTTFQTRLLPFGPHKLRAFYNGGGVYAGTTSTPVSLTVNAQSANGFAVSSTAQATAARQGDFNGDGIADLAITLPNGTIGVLLGNDDGTFQSVTVSPSISGVPVAIADFNGDGLADLVVLDNSNHLDFLAGQGNGTFQAAAQIISTLQSSFVAADFNGDGKPDLAGIDPNGVTILLGKGDGTFQTGIVYAVGQPGSGPLAVGDFNGDGKLDLAARSGTSNVSILLGRGDGTFQPPLNDSVGAQASSLLVADLNNDGRADLITVSFQNTVSVQLGNGDGTFGTPLSYTAGFACTLASGSCATPFFAAVADFNGDGIADLALGNASSTTANNLSILLGNGDGTFQAPVNYQVSSPTLLVAGEFNNDGRTDLYTGGSLYLGATTTLGLTATGGTPQSARVGAAFGSALQATVKDSAGNPVSGVTVTFAAPPTGASAVLSSGSALTNASGVASVTATANSTAGTYTVTANLGTISVSFSLTNTPNFASLTATGGTPQTAQAGAAFGSALQATVKDSSGNPVSGVTVTFAAPPTGASAVLSSGSALTNASGVASVTATANGTVGSYTVTANVGTFSASFSLTNSAAQAASLTATGGTPQFTLSGTAFATALQATLKDAAGNPLSGITVTFAAPPVGASAVLSSGTAVTNASGVASVTATANSTLGTYIVTANFGTLSASFSLTNSATPPASITAIGGTPQSALLNSAFPTALQAVVRDSAGNPMSGITVTFAVPTVGAGATLSSLTALTNGSGVATVTATANNVGGTYNVTASVGALSTSFALTNLVVGANGNLALGKAASQSSTLPGAPTAGAASAVDGNTDGNFFDGSVTATNLDANPWWQVDLGTSAAITSVVVFNRTDCCGSRLGDFWVFISNTPFLATDTPATLQNRPGTFASHQTAAPNPSTTIATTAQGRYVRVQLSSANYLSLAEVQVFGTALPPPPVDLAQGKAATQSSTLPGAPTAAASSAVDGNTDGNFFDGSVTATNLDNNPWWQVDLGASAAVTSVVVFNRTDCCGTRMNDFWVFISDTPFLASDTPATLQGRPATFASHQTAAPNPFTTILAGAQGRYVRVQLSNPNYLSLAEVQVFGTGGAAVTNLSQNKAATQSSTYSGSPAAAVAVDGLTDGNFFGGSVTATNPDANPWWQVDLGASASVSSVVIFNRTDCCGTRLSDYWVFVSDTPFLASDTPTTLQNRPGTFASHQTTAPNPSANIPASAQGRYVRVQLSGVDYLSLAEVQVFGQ